MFSNKIWLSSPTMHGDEMKYMMQAYESNWMSTEGENLGEIEKSICEKMGCGYEETWRLDISGNIIGDNFTECGSMEQQGFF